MREQEFREWLKVQQYTATSIATWLSDARKVEQAHGDLDQSYEADRFDALLGQLVYSKADEQAGKPDPSALGLTSRLYNTLSASRSAIRYYRRFRDAQAHPQGRLSGFDRGIIFAAIAACDAAGSVQAFVDQLEGRGVPQTYWLVHEGALYPSKATVHWAMARRGIEASAGGSECKAVLEELGFVVVDRPALLQARDAFLARMTGFTDFAHDEGPYVEIERRYKDERIAAAQAIAAGPQDDRAAGEALFRLLAIGGQGLPLSWRTLGEVGEADPALRDRFYGAIGALARSGASMEEAVTATAKELEALRDAGIVGLRRGEVTSIPITVWGTLHPEEASWFKISKIAEMGKRFFGRRLFPQTEFREGDLAEWSLLMRTLFSLLDREFGWRPRDMFDVQGFIWVVLDAGYDAEPEDAEAPVALDPTPIWIVTARWGETDGLPRFIERGEWSLLYGREESGANRLVRQMQVGDRIVPRDYFHQVHNLPFDANGGRVSAIRLRALGTVTEASEDGVRVGVDWQEWPEPRTWYFYTHTAPVWGLVDPGESPSADQLRRFILDGEPQDYDRFLNDPFWRDRLFGAPADKVAAPMNPTNLILYGPPGTGKTYTTMERAVGLCGEQPDLDRTALRNQYDRLRAAGRIEFVTFHQNFAYEEFVEGLRPVTGAEGSVGLQLEAQGGIFRTMATTAEEARKSARQGAAMELGDRRVFKMSLGRSGIDDDIFEDAWDGSFIALGYGGEIDWSDYRDYEAIRERWNQDNPGTHGASGHIAQVNRFVADMKPGDLVVVPFGNMKIRAIGEVTGPYEFVRSEEHDYHHRRAVRWLKRFDEPLDYSVVSEIPFTQRSCYPIRAENLKPAGLASLLPGEGGGVQAPQHFVLIIDEINRANISKVFGELITLIEPDKRLGMDNALTVRLPYSRREFGVPANLHIVGTMNTADRSIALLDTALRRRFRFEELAPRPDLLEEVEGVSLGQVLDTINRRLEYLLDRDHAIGHAFFMGEGGASRAAVDDTMRFKVIPLLQEYFFEDWGRIHAVLGDGFLGKRTLQPPSTPEFVGQRERFSWSIRKPFAGDAYATLLGKAPSPEELQSGFEEDEGEGA